MGFRTFLGKHLAKRITKKANRDAQQAVAIQHKWLKKLVYKAKNTKFGQDHNFAQIKNYEDFKANVPIRDYEGLRPYVDMILQGQKDVLWKGKPAYFAKTSGTTSGTKYIPMTKESVPFHFASARNALFAYITETGKAHFLEGKMIFLSGSPELDQKGGVHTGRLSGIVNHHVPAWLRKNQLPTYSTNCIEDWETKLNAIVDETITADMRLISGIPPWIQMYFDRLVERSGKPVAELFPNLSVLSYGGVNFEPYRTKLFQTLGKNVASVETYPASEGFIAYQNQQNDSSLLLNTNAGLFFEFVPASEFFEENPTRISLGDVEIGVNYAIILNSNAGLWGYNIGDTVKFVSKNPYKLLVTGRIKHFISAFGEHVIGEEVESAFLPLVQAQNIAITEFTVAPQVQTPAGVLPYHEWFIEFDQTPDAETLEKLALEIDDRLQKRNAYYLDLIQGKVLQPLKIRALQKGAFQEYMKSIGKLGGQNKVPRLSNDRKIVRFFEQMN